MKNILRGILSLVLVLTLLVGCCAVGYCEEPAAAETETETESDSQLMTITPTIANSFEYSADEWFSTSLNRALLTVLLSLNLNGEVDENDVSLTDALINNTSFVGLSDTTLTVLYQGTEADLLVFYYPELEVCHFSLTTHGSDALTKTALETICPDGCYENELDDIATVIGLLAENVDDSND